MEDVYNIQARYEKVKEKFIQTGTVKTHEGVIEIRPENKKLALAWMEFKEQELSDIYGTSADARIRNAKTLYKQFTTYLSNVLYWFNHLDLKQLTENDLLTVYRNLEKKKLLSVQGKELSDITLKDIYMRVFKNGFFKFIHKDDIAHAIIKRKVASTQEVRFFELDTLKQITNAAELKSHRLAYWLLFDVGLEVSALVQLRKSNFELKKSKNDEEYYIVHVPKEISKKGRRVRNNFVSFTETNQLLKNYLEKLRDSDLLFNFEPHGIYRALMRLNEKYDFRVKPTGDQVSIKDFRSSCATHLLKQGWTTDEVKARLGHAPSSDEIDKYVNYLGLHQERRREQDVKIDFNNYKEKYEESTEHIRKLEAHQEIINRQMEEMRKMVMTLALKEANKRAK
jgi:integrase